MMHARGCARHGTDDRPARQWAQGPSLASIGGTTNPEEALMSQASWRVATAMLLIAVGACSVKSSSTDISPSINRNPTCENAVAVYNSRAEVPNSYYELAWVTAEGNSVWTTDA